MENKQTLELLQQIEQTSRQKLRLERMRCLFSFVTALCCVAVVGIIVTALPQLTDLFARMETTLSSLEAAAAELETLDLKGMVTGVEELVAAGQITLQESADKLNKLDIETLNRAIEDLAAVVEPLAKLFR